MTEYFSINNIYNDLFLVKLISLTTSYGDDRDAVVDARAAAAAPSLTDIQNVRYETVGRLGGGAKLHDKGAGSWECFPSASKCKNVTLFDVHLEPAKGWTCENVEGGVEDVSPSGLSECFKN